MDITVRERILHVQIIEIGGRLEAFSAGDLKKTQTKLLEDDNKNFIVDLRPTTFMDSIGLSTLLSLLKQSKKVGGDVVLVKPVDPAAYKILTMTRFDQVFQIVDTVEDAFKHF